MLRTPQEPAQISCNPLVNGSELSAVLLRDASHVNLKPLLVALLVVKVRVGGLPVRKLRPTGRIVGGAGGESRHVRP